jgi:hypothetical protein
MHLQAPDYLAATWGQLALVKDLGTVLGRRAAGYFAAAVSDYIAAPWRGRASTSWRPGRARAATSTLAQAPKLLGVLRGAVGARALPAWPSSWSNWTSRCCRPRRPPRWRPDRLHLVVANGLHTRLGPGWRPARCAGRPGAALGGRAGAAAGRTSNTTSRRIKHLRIASAGQPRRSKDCFICPR